MQQKYMDFDEPHTLWEKINGYYDTKIKKSSYTIRKELYGVRLEDIGQCRGLRPVHSAGHRPAQPYRCDSEKMSDREHSSFLLNGTNPTGSD